MTRNNKSGGSQREGKQQSIARHEAKCRICTHSQRAEIERDFLSWTSPTRIAKAYHVSRDSVYRHVWATDLLPRRQKNVRSALEKIIEQAGEVEVNASSVVAAVGAYARINATGQWVERSETVNLNELFDRMSRDELEAYARDGALPAWFPVRIATGEQTRCSLNGC